MWDTSQLSYQFQDLEIWTHYTVKMCAFTSKGNGPYSASLPENTDEAGKIDYQLIVNLLSLFPQPHLESEGSPGANSKNAL